MACSGSMEDGEWDGGRPTYGTTGPNDIETQAR